MSENKETQQTTPARPIGGAAIGGGRGILTGKKAKDFKGTWVKIIKYSKAFLPAVIIALVFVVGATVFQIVGPNILGKLTDEIGKVFPKLIDGVYALPLTNIIDMNAIVSIGLMLICFYAGSFILRVIENLIMAKVTQKITRKMRSDISGKINKLPLGYFHTTSYGDVLSRVTNDVDTIGQTLNQNIDSLMAAITLFMGSLIMMLITNWIMALVAVGASLLGFLLMAIIMSKSQKFFKAQQKQLGALNGQIEENYTGHNIVKVYRASRQSKQKFEEVNKKLHDSNWKAQFFSGLMMPLMTLIGNIGYVAVCVVGAVLAMNGTITFGVIVAFMLYVRLFTQPLSQIAQAGASLQSTAAAGERVFEFLEAKEMDDESHKFAKLPQIKGEVEFKNVRFGYTPDKTVINDFSAHVRPGQKVAIVGPTGAGKTTMVNLLMRFYEINSGEILIDGIPVTTVKREDVHEIFDMVLQDTWMFEGTIKENIVYSEYGVTDEDVIAACKTVGLDHFIRTLPDGYDTVLNDKASLSEGQKQLLTIARAIIKDSPLLILDEATSSVDTRTERIVQEAMDKLTQGRTSFVIAHRLSTIKNSDLILVMKDGDIIESGSHTDLITKGGFYAELYNSQFEMA